MENENKNLNDLFTFAEFDEMESEHIAAPRYSYWKSVFRTFFRNKFTVAVAILLLFILCFALIQPMRSGYSPIVTPNINSPELKFLKPCKEHIFGTDHVGNEVFDAVWAGARNSIIISFVCTGINMIIGILVGRGHEVPDHHHDLYGVGDRGLLHPYPGHDHPGPRVQHGLQVPGHPDHDHDHEEHPSLSDLRHHDLRGPYDPEPHFLRGVPFLHGSYMGLGLGTTNASLGQSISLYTSYMRGYPHLFWIPVSVVALISLSLYIVGQRLADAADPRTHM